MAAKELKIRSFCLESTCYSNPEKIDSECNGGGGVNDLVRANAMK